MHILVTGCVTSPLPPPPQGEGRRWGLRNSQHADLHMTQCTSGWANMGPISDHICKVRSQDAQDATTIIMPTQCCACHALLPGSTLGLLPPACAMGLGGRLWGCRSAATCPRLSASVLMVGSAPAGAAAASAGLPLAGPVPPRSPAVMFVALVPLLALPAPPPAGALGLKKEVMAPLRARTSWQASGAS
jgi:hypothetical protein